MHSHTIIKILLLVKLKCYVYDNYLILFIIIIFSDDLCFIFTLETVLIIYSTFLYLPNIIIQSQLRNILLFCKTMPDMRHKILFLIPISYHFQMKMDSKSFFKVAFYFFFLTETRTFNMNAFYICLFTCGCLI